MVLECVVNISEGRDEDVIATIASAAASDLLDVHTDPHHHRSVLTLVGEDAPRAVAVAAVEHIDIHRHEGVHPRFGAVDVVPFSALEGSTFSNAVAARDRFCAWAADELQLPCFTYGEERTLPEVRRHAFAALMPTCGPHRPHPTAGAVAVGARPLLVAYNVWLAEPDLDTARRIAAEIRSPQLRALGLSVGDRVQVSMNLIDPVGLGPDRATDLVSDRAEIAGCELVGLIPEAALMEVPRQRWEELDLSPARTIGARLEDRFRLPR